jgi:hypothetical protein
MWRGKWPPRVACMAGTLALACATHTAPVGFLPSVQDAEASAFGGWIELTLRGDPRERRVQGELLAVTTDSVWVLTGEGGVVVPTATVLRGKLTGYLSGAGAVTGWTALGVLSTLSNGIVLIFTAPLWVITGTVAGSAASYAPVRQAPPLPWAELAVFARFPQGMPPGLPLDTLKLESP